MRAGATRCSRFVRRGPIWALFDFARKGRRFSTAVVWRLVALPMPLSPWQSALAQSHAPGGTARTGRALSTGLVHRDLRTGSAACTSCALLQVWVPWHDNRLSCLSATPVCQPTVTVGFFRRPPDSAVLKFSVQRFRQLRGTAGDLLIRVHQSAPKCETAPEVRAITFLYSRGELS
jgi:hypothetical protein